jgi:hypothetical protein
MAFVSAHPRIVGTIVSAIFAGLAFAFPDHAAEALAASTFMLGALHVSKPGDK